MMGVEMDGSGTEGDPYRISCVEQLQYVNQELDAYYKLVSDIDATNSNKQEFTSIGDRENPFTGTFDGNNYEIRNLCINQPEQSNVGLFDRIDDGGRVKNLGLISASITGRNEVGSIVGANWGEVESSYTKEGNVSGGNSVGGLVGFNFGGKVESSYTVKVDVSGGNSVGGLVGFNSGGVETSYTVKVDVSGGNSVGGLVGENLGGVETSYTVKVDVSGGNSVGGLVGENTGEVESSYTVDNNVSGDESTGNLVGENFRGGPLESCFNMAKLDNPNSLEEPNLVLLRGNYRILYIVEAKTLYLQIDNEIYSRRDVSPIVVQSLVDDETEIGKITQKFRSSVVRLCDIHLPLTDR